MDFAWGMEKLDGLLVGGGGAVSFCLVMLMLVAIGQDKPSSRSTEGAGLPSPPDFLEPHRRFRRTVGPAIARPGSACCGGCCGCGGW